MAKERFHTIALIYFEEGENEYKTEAVRAIKEGDYYRVVSIPFFAKHLAVNDVIAVEDEDGVHYFDDIITASGHSTVRGIFFDHSAIEPTINHLMESGAVIWRYEESVLFAVDVSPEIDYGIIKAYLEKKQQEGEPDYEEACLGWK